LCFPQNAFDEKLTGSQHLDPALKMGASDLSFQPQDTADFRIAEKYKSRFPFYFDHSR
jgi:hypothetical protein